MVYLTQVFPRSGGRPVQKGKNIICRKITNMVRQNKFKNWDQAPYQKNWYGKTKGNLGIGRDIVSFMYTNGHTLGEI